MGNENQSDLSTVKTMQADVELSKIIGYELSDQKLTQNLVVEEIVNLM